ncbi:hypothetical protein [Rossellomorea sp. DA94]|uniref:hypothetical protein n=1 Tax=Rossellomorea sp. DA94 TaxID=3038653 RepID=UPI0024477120|nr:hypothetical protein [Rossellomorea sp. DA94]WGG45225.1 hypothetical protein P8596_21235 [Rossellomorea sp. DA94]
MEDVLEVRKTALELINNLESRSKSINKLFLKNEIEEGTNRLLIFTEDIVVLTEGLSVIDSEQTTYRISEINQKLNDILGALEMNDPLYVSEILEQEIIPLLIYWKEKLS